jgi:hypothetical protein
MPKYEIARIPERVIYSAKALSFVSSSILLDDETESQ